MIGNKLKVARSASGLSLRALADTMDGIVSAQAIGKYERNEDMPSSRVLIALARALAVSEEYLLSEDELSLEGVDFRKKVGTSSREEAMLEARAIHMLERYLAVEDMLQMFAMLRMQPVPCETTGDLATTPSRILPNCWRNAASRCCRSISTTWTDLPPRYGARATMRRAS